MQLFDLVVNTILAICAIVASVYAIRAVTNEKKAKRAFLCAKSHPGNFETSFDLIRDSYLKIFMSNYGQNPATEITGKIMIFFFTKIDIINNKLRLVKIFNSKSINPIANNSKLEIQCKFTNIFPYDKKYVVYYIKYYDRILNESFHDKFYWKEGDDKILIEVNDDEHKKLEKLANDELSKDKHS